jgi:NAD(P)-dependent dehydrogenase (short-subunit alcohol dehydrogenase family)
MEDFSERVVVVTGAAGSLGQTVARTFHAAGARLVLVDHAKEGLKELFGDLLRGGPHLPLPGIDLTEVEQVESVAKSVEEELGKADVLVNVAGGFRGGVPVSEMEPDLWDFVLSLNAKSAFLMSRSMVPLLIKAEGGAIINIAARPGQRAGRGNSAYAASKSAVLRLTESLSSELKHQGIRVNAVIPGTMDTPGNRESMPDGDPERWVSTEAVAQVILFLASDRASAIHGAAVPVLGLT